MNCNHELVWHNCYKGGFDLISPDSFAHPAKMSASLCYRILDHLKELELLNDSDTILDPMSGTGMTAICAGAKGYKAITIELEEKFIGFQKENKEYAGRKLKRELDWTILQGDARKLSELLTEQGVITVTSPPYAEAQSGGGISKVMRGEGDYNVTTHLPGSVYQPSEHGTTPGQIGNLKDTPLKVITSPPYGELGIGDYKKKRDDFVAWIKNELDTKGFIEWNGNQYSEAEWREANYGRLDGRVMVGSPKMGTEGYNPDNADNIGNLKDVPLEQNERMFINSGQAFFELPSDGVEGVMPVCVPTLRSGMSQDIIGKQFSVLSLDFEIWQQLWQQLQEVIISGHTTTVNILATLSFITPGRIPELRKYFMKPEYPLAITHTNFEVGTEPPLTTLARNIKGSLAVNETSQISQISRITHNTIICQLPYIFKPLKTVTSPPYDNRLRDEDREHHGGILAREFQKGNTKMVDSYSYSKDKENLGNKMGESYLEAMKIVYAEIAKVSDVLAIVLKNPTRNGKLRRLDLDTISLLEQTGWTIHCQHRALLFEELEQNDMFAGAQKKVKGRMSFFKRLSWQKGQPVASWEDVIIAVRNGGGNLKVVTSPPYTDTDGKGLTRRNRQTVANSWAVKDEKPRQDGYGDTPGQIGKLKDK